MSVSCVPAEEVERLVAAKLTTTTTERTTVRCLTASPFNICLQPISLFFTNELERLCLARSSSVMQGKSKQAKTLNLTAHTQHH
jgi:hypothetical protein